VLGVIVMRTRKKLQRRKSVLWLRRQKSQMLNMFGPNNFGPMRQWGPSG
jgi:hypothetical protein